VDHIFRLLRVFRPAPQQRPFDSAFLQGCRLAFAAPDVIDNAFNAGHAGAPGAAVKGLVRLDAVADDPAAAVSADWSQFVDCTFERIEYVMVSRGYDLKGQVIVIPAHFTFSHISLLDR
jgi:hypothetical protein